MLGPLSSHSCDCSDALWAPQDQASKVRTYLSVCSTLPLQHKICVSKRPPNAAETWQRGYESVRFVTLFYYRAGLDEAPTKRRCKSIWYPLAANFASRFGTLWQLTSHPGWALEWG